MSKILDRIEKGDTACVMSMTKCISNPAMYETSSVDNIISVGYLIGYTIREWDETLLCIVLTVIFDNATVECEKFDSSESLRKFVNDIMGFRR